MKPTNAPAAMLVTVALSFAMAATGCAADAEEPAPEVTAGESSAGATSVAGSLEAFAGEWVAEDAREPGMRVFVTVDTSAKGPDGESWGTTVKIARADERRVPWRDRAPFFSVGGGRSCSSVSMGGGTSLEICHEVTLKGRVLTHTLTSREKKFLVPVGSSRSVQTFRLDGDGATYRYEIDGKVEEEVALTRP